ncbi:exodeoxyribonuclease VII large subunit [Denitrobacterium detoxificans]|uniref:Exodeoxyribonuclease 7 large subunit n=1 Tax=Denitrobacterium detoxificans TaxID=79604 RepID=A0A172RYL2_9ACTN|nr:exodeoxyribonuclease VII large subunit [Denitrobacterium detoxificans]ANE22821.1 exodeoxyribonuclease VII large subunit [Denitrobacterium detoxificans]SEO68468.1 Exodeoxyribonuclease VII large subunit [Denitrobacterium detoxificans]
MAEGEGVRKPLSVSQAMQLAKGALESCTVTLVGEVSEVSNKPGYKAVYFTVKDEASSMPCMMWQNRFRATGVQLRVGMLVQLTGRFTLYAAKGRMNFDVFGLALAGEGDLRAKVANLARKLQAEGLTDAARKRPLPTYPQVIGLVTSPRGAAVHDVLRTLRRRYPLARVVLAGVPVEGAQAPAGLVEGLQCVVAAGAEEVLLVRGGGSFEDLMPFNDEGLARAIVACPVPVITGIGHEPDTSIADMVADLRASTPTAAAESAAPDIRELREGILARGRSMHDRLAGRLERSSMVIGRFEDKPFFRDPHFLLAAPAQAIDIAAGRLQRAIPGGLVRDAAALAQYETRLATYGRTALQATGQQLAGKAQRLSTAGKAILPAAEQQIDMRAARLNDLSPLAILGRGYSLARTEAGTIVKTVEQAPAGSRISVRVSDGTLDCAVESSTPNPSQS